MLKTSFYFLSKKVEGTSNKSNFSWTQKLEFRGRKETIAIAIGSIVAKSQTKRFFNFCGLRF